MTQAKPHFLNFQEYLKYDDGTDNRYEVLNGELVKLPPESEENDWIAVYLRDELIRLTHRRLVRVHTCEVQVIGNPLNRYPDLVILREEHLDLTAKRLTITLDMPPPAFVAEVVSPGQENRNRDYKDKRRQYQERGIPEYWILDRELQKITVLRLVEGVYEESVFQGGDRIISPSFPELELTAEQVLRAGD